MNTWLGQKLKISIFGESHGRGVGCVIDGLPTGLVLDYELLRHDMCLRKGTDYDYSTPRKEADRFQIISGVMEGKTNGYPLCVMFENKSTRHSDYNTRVPRPAHADFPAMVKYGTSCDISGGGHFSARLTAPLVFLGAICRQQLINRGIQTSVAITGIGDYTAKDFYSVSITDELMIGLDRAFPVIDENDKSGLLKELENAKSEGDSTGGTVMCCITGLPIGLGEPYFDSVESSIARLSFSIPGVKGIEFGKGFQLAKMRGSAANDQLNAENIKKYLTGENKKAEIAYTNSAGGIVGGLTNSMPIIYKVAFKPIPSIAKEQKSVDMQSYEPAIVRTEGRHDVCAAVRGAFVVRATACICIYDFILNSDYEHR